MPLPDELSARVLAYIDDDVDEHDRAELRALLAMGDPSILESRFSAELAFGTAGLRGLIGAGPACMNRAVVARATAAACAHLIASVPDARARGLCIGFDGRHRSRELAEETACVAAGAGMHVHVFDAPVPTPVLAFAVLDRKAAGGVMITASHNPKTDNGYKLYWENGAQIIPPHDREIETAMRAISSIRALPRSPKEQRLAHGMEAALGSEIEQRYLAGALSIARALPCPSTERALPIAYTALHGVGERFVQKALAGAGFSNVHSVAEQSEPNPDFPTAAFPNPEEPGAMDRVLALAGRIDAALVLANDPDADRLAAAARRDGTLQQLSGNDLGALLTEHVLARAPDPRALTVLASIVSSPLIGKIARAHGAHYEPTLTGFKWIENRALELERERGLSLAIGVEEALGYSIGTLVRDKDGISAALVTAQLAAELHADRRTLCDALDALHARHGVHESQPFSLRADGPDGARRMAEVIARLRGSPPKQVAGLARIGLLDLLSGHTEGSAHLPRPLPPTDAIFWELEGGTRVAIRPSGTEPKLKLYLDLCVPVGPGERLHAARARASAQAAELTSALRALLSA